MNNKKSQMQRIVWGLIFIAVCWFQYPGATAQTLQLNYVAPTDTMLRHFHQDSIFDVWTTGYRAVALRGGHVAIFQNIAPPNVKRTYDSLQTNTILRTRLDSMMQISGGLVHIDMFLIDDRTGLVNDSTMFSISVDSNGVRYVWPAASVWSSAVYATCSSQFCARIGLGERASIETQTQPGGWLEWEGTILHEIFHTQFLPDPQGRKNKWGSIHIAYGGDRGHWISELLGDKQVPLEEGFATFFGHWHNNPGGINRLISFLNDTTYRYVLGSRSVLTGTAEVWDAPHIEPVSGPVDSIPAEFRNRLPLNMRRGAYRLRLYKWLDVPGYYLLFNEQTATAFFYLFWRYTNGDPNQAFRMIYSSAQSMAGTNNLRKRYLTYAVNRLALSLEDFAGTAQGQAAQNAGRLTSSMFPFALLDILTHFGMIEQKYKRECDVTSPDRNPRAYTEYWNHRDRVRQLVLPHISRNAIDMERAVEVANNYFRQPTTILP